MDVFCIWNTSFLISEEPLPLVLYAFNADSIFVTFSSITTFRELLSTSAIIRFGVCGESCLIHSAANFFPKGHDTYVTSFKCKEIPENRARALWRTVLKLINAYC